MWHPLQSLSLGDWEGLVNDCRPIPLCGYGRFHCRSMQHIANLLRKRFDFNFYRLRESAAHREVRRSGAVSLLIVSKRSSFFPARAWEDIDSTVIKIDSPAIGYVVLAFRKTLGYCLIYMLEYHRLRASSIEPPVAFAAESASAAHWIEGCENNFRTHMNDTGGLCRIAERAEIPSKVVNFAVPTRLCAYQNDACLRIIIVIDNFDNLVASNATDCMSG